LVSALRTIASIAGVTSGSKIDGGCGSAHVLVGHRHGRVADEGRPHGQQLVEQAAGAVQVGARVDLLALGLLGRQVLRGADDRGGLRHGHAGVAHRTGDAEVHDLDLAGAGQHDVGRLDVAVDDARPVAVLQRLEDADGHLHGPLGQQLAPGVQQLAQGRAVDVLHHDVRDRDAVDVVLAGVVHGDDRGVVERGGRLGLPAETGLEGRIAGKVHPQRLHGDRTAQAGVMGEVHLGHATTAEHRAQLVPAAEATRLFHSSALSSNPYLDVHDLNPINPRPTPARSYGTGRSRPIRALDVRRYPTGMWPGATTRVTFVSPGAPGGVTAPVTCRAPLP
jgi:hypothetical protein